MLCGCFVAQIQGGMVMVGGGLGMCVCKASVQGGKSFIWGWGAAVLLPLFTLLHKSKLEWGWLGGVGDVSVQGERAR